MMPQDMHKDEGQDMDMISTVLRKVADEMDKMDADSFLPEHMKPKAEVPVEASPLDAEMPLDDDMEGSEDPSLLAGLMDKAGSADDEGMLPEDASEDIDPAIADVVAAKKKELPR